MAACGSEAGPYVGAAEQLTAAPEPDHELVDAGRPRWTRPLSACDQRQTYAMQVARYG